MDADQASQPFLVTPELQNFAWRVEQHLRSANMAELRHYLVAAVGPTAPRRPRRLFLISRILPLLSPAAASLPAQRPFCYEEFINALTHRLTEVSPEQFHIDFSLPLCGLSRPLLRHDERQNNQGPNPVLPLSRAAKTQFREWRDDRHRWWESVATRSQTEAEASLDMRDWTTTPGQFRVFRVLAVLKIVGALFADEDQSGLCEALRDMSVLAYGPSRWNMSAPIASPVSGY